MSKPKTQQDLFVCEYQKHLICSYVMQMSARKQKEVALYQFGECPSELAYRTAKSIAGDDQAFESFLDRFPPSWHERLAIQDHILDYLLDRAMFKSLEPSSVMDRRLKK